MNYSGERRLPACSSRQPAANINPQTVLGRHHFPTVEDAPGKLPGAAGWQPALPRIETYAP